MDSDRRHHLFDELAVVGKAFGSPKRLELVELLAQGERTVESLARTAGMGMTTASAHLQVLKLANLVRTRRDGTKVYYRLAGDDVAELYVAMRRVARERSADVSRALEAYLNLPGSDEVGLVSRADLKRLLERGEVTLVDVRPPEEYLAGHIPGSQNVPLGDLGAQVEQLRSAGAVVAYCRGSFCVMAHDAVRILGGEGIAARRLEDGMLEWRAAGLPVAAGAS
ncbi:metalloregulator ArsR/SmtB family transcription factor [Nocardioides sp. SOB77]|uniref:Metalloregulator ArsR/SmtB family transcription factor n=1 Tax=Nocardioides oceani TaxID=3058369 RepID=A0ABT8FL00_9ACTN|nr:metalloregulator ArsR/SmtB family transcription factor [Nocardioides oceani]MDN4175209.1 metalloregulator ArsR/SmtB family transcription factor [Nocardioides oceani]